MVDENYVYRFARFQFDAWNKKLYSLETGGEIEIFGKCLEVLNLLLEADGSLVLRDEILDLVWADSIVEDGNINVAISHLRKAFRDAGYHREIIQTVPKRGYRITAAIRRVALKEFTPPDELTSSDSFNPASVPISAIPSFSDSFELVVAPAQINANSANSLDEQKQRSFASLLDFSRFGKLSVFNVNNKFNPFNKTAYFSWQAIVIAVLSLALALVLLKIGYTYLYSEVTSYSKHGQPVSLTILPFKNSSANAKDDENLLGFAIADKLINSVANIPSIRTMPIWMVPEPIFNESNELDVSMDGLSGFVLYGSYAVENGAVFAKVKLVRVSDKQTFIENRFEVEDNDSVLSVRDTIVANILKMTELENVTRTKNVLLDSDSTSQEAYLYYLKGVQNYFASKYSEAEENFMKSISIEPTNANAFAQIGQIYYTKALTEFGNRADLAKSEQMIKRAISIEPENLLFQVELGNLYLFSQQFAKAIKTFEHTYKRDPKIPSLLFSMAIVYRYIGDIDRSLMFTEAFLQQTPGAKQVFNQLLYNGQYVRFYELLPFTSDNAYVEFYRGYVNLYQGNREISSAHFDKANSINPNSMQSQTGMIYKHMVDGDVATAKMMLGDLDQKLKALQIVDGEGVYKIAQAHAMLNETDNALRLLRTSIEAGFVPYVYFENDPLMANIRSNPKYKELVESARLKSKTLTDLTD